MDFFGKKFLNAKKTMCKRKTLINEAAEDIARWFFAFSLSFLFLSEPARGGGEGRYQRYIHDRPENVKPFIRQLTERFGLEETTKFDRSVALVVGISRYEHLKPLVSTANDAIEIRDFFLKSGEFDRVVLLTESHASKDKIEYFMEDYFPNLLESVHGPSRFLFYFSGHGTSRGSGDKAVGYLQLSDNRPNEFRRAIGMDRIGGWERVIAQHAQHSLFVIDTCMSGLAGKETMAGTEFSAHRSAAELLRNEASFLITAGAGHQQALASAEWEGSLFNAVFLNGLRRGEADHLPSDGLITLRELFTYVEGGVAGQSKNSQVPQIRQFRKSGVGDFFFLSPRSWGKRPSSSEISSAPKETLGDMKKDDNDESLIRNLLLEYDLVAPELSVKFKTGESGRVILSWRLPDGYSQEEPETWSVYRQDRKIAEVQGYSYEDWPVLGAEWKYRVMSTDSERSLFASRSVLIKQREPVISRASRRVMLEKQLLWVTSGAWSPSDDSLIVVDGVRNSVLEVSTTGKITLPPVHKQSPSNLYSVIHRDGNKFLIENEDTDSIVFLSEDLSSLDHTISFNGLSGKDDSTVVKAVYEWVPWGNKLLAFTDIFSSEDETWSKAFLSFGEGGVDHIYIRFPIDSEVANFYRLGMRHVAAVDDLGYILIMERIPYILEVQEDSGISIRLEHFPADFRTAPQLVKEDRLLHRGPAEITKFYQTIEDSTMPVGLYSWDGSLYLLGRKASEKSGALWWLIKLDPGTGMETSRTQLPTTASHLVLLPGERNWALIEKGPVVGVGQHHAPYMEISSMLLIPSHLVDGQ